MLRGLLIPPFVSRLLGVLLILATASVGLAANNSWQIVSPDRKNAFTVKLTDGVLSYGVKRSGDILLDKSPLGLRREDAQFETNLSVVSVGRIDVVRQKYELIHGKRHEVASVANRQILTFTNGQGDKLELQIRVANDGVAFRYRFPETNSTPKKVLSEASGFAVPMNASGWIQPQDAPCDWAPGYEDTYIDVTPGTPAPEGNAVINGIGRDRAGGWVFPALFKLAGGRHWMLLTESGLDGEYCACHLAAKSPGGVYTIAFPNPGEPLRNSPVEPSSVLPWTLPWRVVVIGDTAGQIAESTLVTDLAPPCRLADTSWIKPGRAAWGWWSDGYSATNANKMMAFIELAGDMGWEHCLLDAHWWAIPESTFKDRLVTRAKERGVVLDVWEHSKKMYDPAARRVEMDHVVELGVSGLKIDFWCSEKQIAIQTYQAVLEDAAARHLMVNFHGSTLPRGWERTWPNLMSYEGVLGAESYLFFEGYPKNAPHYATLLPFMRNAVGPMDYTPVTFSDGRYPRITTNPYELALTVVFESGIIHLADSVDAYRSLPEAPKAFLKSVPAAWDETRCVVGEPGVVVVMARRKGQEWWVGGINGTDVTREQRVDFSFLGKGTWKSSIIADGDADRTFAPRTRDSIRANDAETVVMRPHGGFVMHIVK